MDNPLQLYQSIRCPKCQHRLNKPLELKCKHILCRDCLESNAAIFN